MAPLVKLGLAASRPLGKALPSPSIYFRSGSLFAALDFGYNSGPVLRGTVLAHGGEGSYSHRHIRLISSREFIGV